MISLPERERVTSLTRKEFMDKPMVWGVRDCLVAARAHLIAAGYSGLPKIPNYTNETGALKALKKAGYDSMEAIFDDILEPIYPAHMLLGDIAVMQGEGKLDAVVISAGQKVLGYSEGYLDKGMVTITPKAIKKAWRI